MNSLQTLYPLFCTPTSDFLLKCAIGGMTMFFCIEMSVAMKEAVFKNRKASTCVHFSTLFADHLYSARGCLHKRYTLSITHSHSRSSALFRVDAKQTVSYKTAARTTFARAQPFNFSANSRPLSRARR